MPDGNWPNPNGLGLWKPIIQVKSMARRNPHRACFNKKRKSRKLKMADKLKRQNKR